MEPNTSRSMRVPPEVTAWPTLLFGVVLSAALNFEAVRAAEHPASSWHLAGAVALPLVVFVSALGWRLTWPHRLLRDAYAAAIALLLIAQVTTYYLRIHNMLVGIGQPWFVAYPCAALGWLVMAAGLVGLLPGGPVAPDVYRVLWRRTPNP